MNINNDCLHCVVSEVVHDWFERHGERFGDQVVIDVPLAIDKLSQVVVELAQMPSDRGKRRGAMKLAHDCIDAHLKAKQTGRPVPIEVKAIPDG